MMLSAPAEVGRLTLSEVLVNQLRNETYVFIPLLCGGGVLSTLFLIGAWRPVAAQPDHSGS